MLVALTTSASHLHTANCAGHSACDKPSTSRTLQSVCFNVSQTWAAVQVSLFRSVLPDAEGADSNSSLTVSYADMQTPPPPPYATDLAELPEGVLPRL